MECYICHELIKRHEYVRHVGSHLAGDDLGTRPQPNASIPTFSYDTATYDHYGTAFPAHSAARWRTRAPPEHGRTLHPTTLSPDDQDLFPSLASPSSHRMAHFTPPRSPARTPEVSSHVFHRQAPTGSFTQPNAFEMWLQNRQHDFPKYTTIDGQGGRLDSEAQDFREAAKALRGDTKEEVVRIVKHLKGLPCGDSKKTCLELVQKAPIFPGLVAHTFTHLMACPRRGWVSSDDWSDRMSELKRLVERWAKYDDTECILSYDTIKDRLLGILRATKVGPEEHKCNSTLLNEAMVLSSDILNLAALAALCITDSQKNILDERGNQAEKLVELFHNLLEANVKPEERYRRYFLNALISLSKGSRYCPRGIYLAKGAVSGLVSESEGGFGLVYKGRIDFRLVAVKALKQDDHNKQLCREAVVWRHLRHHNCLPMYGICTEGPNISAAQPALVSPWMDQGTLSKYLERNPKANRTKLILDVVRGLNYLHSMKPHIAHRDIKPENILITNSGRACLADFGLVSIFDDADDHFRTATSQIVMGGTRDYMAPEIFEVIHAKDNKEKRKVNTRACDMYALGCTIYMAYTGRHPPVWFQVNAAVNEFKRPEFPEGKIPPDMWSFVENLLSYEPSGRLTAWEALDWMEVKAHQEGVDTRLALLEEEWEWRPRNDKCIWSVSV